MMYLPEQMTGTAFLRMIYQMEGEVSLVAGRSQREKRRSYKDLLREEEIIDAEVRKSSKKRPKVRRRRRDKRYAMDAMCYGNITFFFFSFFSFFYSEVFFCLFCFFLSKRTRMGL